MNKLELKVDKTQEFFEQHNIEENRFESLKCRTIFQENGFVIDKEANIDRSH